MKYSEPSKGLAQYGLSVNSCLYLVIDKTGDTSSMEYYGDHPIAKNISPNIDNAVVGCHIVRGQMLRYDAWKKIKFPGKFASIFDHYHKDDNYHR